MQYSIVKDARPTGLPATGNGRHEVQGVLRCQRGVTSTIPCFCHYSARACSQSTLPDPSRTRPTTD